MMRFNRMLSAPTPLLDRLVDARRGNLVERMARDLIHAGAFSNERDAIMALFPGRGYSAADVCMLVDDARQMAQQEVVAREMSRG